MINLYDSALPVRLSQAKARKARLPHIRLMAGARTGSNGSVRQIWRLFDRLAGDYDQVMPFFREFGEAIIAVVDPPAGCRVLDLGAGRGALTEAALRRGCHVTAADAAPEMIRRLALDHPGAVAQVMNAEELGLPPGEFDLVMASFVIHLLDQPAAGMAEAFRVLKPGGRFVLTGGSARHHDDTPAIWSSPLTDRLDMLFLEFTPHLPSTARIGHPIDAAELLEAAGFVDLREDHATVEITVPHAEALWRWSMSLGYRAFVEALPEARRAEFRRRLLDMPVSNGLLRRRTCLWSGWRPEQPCPPPPGEHPPGEAPNGRHANRVKPGGRHAKPGEAPGRCHPTASEAPD